MESFGTPFHSAALWQSAADISEKKVQGLGLMFSAG